MTNKRMDYHNLQGLFVKSTTEKKGCVTENMRTRIIPTDRIEMKEAAVKRKKWLQWEPWCVEKALLVNRSNRQHIIKHQKLLQVSVSRHWMVWIAIHCNVLPAGKCLILPWCREQSPRVINWGSLLLSLYLGPLQLSTYSHKNTGLS